MIFHIPAYENVYKPENKQAVGMTRKLLTSLLIPE
jgi:hypothetical protein